MFRQIIISSLYIASYILLLNSTFAQSAAYFPNENWRSSTPQAQGLDESQLNSFIEELRKGKLQRPISSLVIVKNGYLVVNEIFGNYNGKRAHTLQSVTKSISSTLVGVAIQNGFIQGVNQKVVDFFPEYDNIKNMDANKQAMNLHHALTMRTGQAWYGERQLDGLNSYSGDKMKYVLDYKMATAPGRDWYYNSGIAVLLGGLLQNATKMSTIDFAENYLFQPMGITSGRWSWSHRGIPHTGGGLYLTPQDMARIGYLYLRDGKWGNQQLLPSWWVEEATKRHVPHADDISGVTSIGYGYMWWLLSFNKKDQDPTKRDIFMAYGHWGQFIFVIPEHDLVVVITNNNTASYPEEKQPISLLYQYILPAVNPD